MTLSNFRILQEGCQLIISLIRNLCQDFLKQQTDGWINFSFIGPVSTVYYVGQAVNTPINMIM